MLRSRHRLLSRIKHYLAFSWVSASPLVVPVWLKHNWLDYEATKRPVASAVWGEMSRHCEEQKSITEPVSCRHTLLSLCPHHTPAQWGNQGQQRTMMTMTWALQDSSPQRKREAQRLNGPGLMMMSQVCICPLELLNFDFDTFGKEDHYNGETHKHPNNFKCRQLRDAF